MWRGFGVPARLGCVKGAGAGPASGGGHAVRVRPGCCHASAFPFYERGSTGRWQGACAAVRFVKEEECCGCALGTLATLGSVRGSEIFKEAEMHQDERKQHVTDAHPAAQQRREGVGRESLRKSTRSLERAQRTWPQHSTHAPRRLGTQVRYNNAGACSGRPRLSEWEGSARPRHAERNETTARTENGAGTPPAGGRGRGRPVKPLSAHTVPCARL